MADDLMNHVTTEFSRNWIARTAQKKSRLMEFCDMEDFDGERKRFDRLGNMSSGLISSRKANTPITDQDTDQRWCYHTQRDLANLLDQWDAKKLAPLGLPDSEYVVRHAAAYNRDVDDTIVAAVTADVETGPLGTTNFALPNSQKIVHGSVGLTLTKLLAAKEILDSCDDDEYINEPAVFLVTAKQINTLLATTEIKSADYNTVKALANGQIDTFLGFKFIQFQRLALSGSTRTCLCWRKGAMRGIFNKKGTTISVRNDKSNALQIYSSWQLGATRLHDELVVSVEVTE
jgi:hypothetical protein